MSVTLNSSEETQKGEEEKFHSKLIGAKIYDLGQPYWWGMPVHPEDPPFTIYLYRYHEQTRKIFENIAPGLGFADSIDLISTSMHSGTHIDALCHMSRNGKIFGGVTASEFETHKGYTRYGSEEIPILVKRAVLLDFPAYKNLDILPERYEITPDDVEGVLERENVKIQSGDAALVRTGYSRYMTIDSDKYLHAFAGMNAQAARHLATKRISLACSDNLAFGVPKPFELHQVFLVDNGIFMVKSMNLEELARDHVYVSTIIITPLKIKGSTGSLVRPIAIVP